MNNEYFFNVRENMFILFNTTVSSYVLQFFPSLFSSGQSDVLINSINSFQIES